MNASPTENTTGAGETAAQILDRATLPLAYHWKATADKAAMIADFLGVKSINDPLFAAMEDAVEARFHEMIVADNRRLGGEPALFSGVRHFVG
jgi:hypothetical protein